MPTRLLYAVILEIQELMIANLDSNAEFQLEYFAFLENRN